MSRLAFKAELYRCLMVSRKPNPHRDSAAATARRRPLLLGDSRETRPVKYPMTGANWDTQSVSGLLIGYARVTTDERDLTAQRDALTALGFAPERIYVDHGLSGTNRARARAARGYGRRGNDVRAVTKLDRLARALPDARDIVAELTGEVRLGLGGSVRDPTGTGRQIAVQHPGHGRRVRVKLDHDEDSGGMKVARAKGRLRGKRPKLSPGQESHLIALQHAGTHTSAELAALFSVARSTVYLAIERAPAAAPAER